MRPLALVDGSVQPGGREPAPPGLALVQGFVNTVDQEHGPDLLDLPGGFAAWLDHRGLGVARVTPPDLAAARELREALRALRLGHADGAPADPAAAATLDAVAGRVRLRPRFAPPRLEPAAQGIDAALGVVLAEAYAAMADGTWRRLKACPGHRCGWAFYDRSPNASASWCSMDVCGGRAKARAYYARRSATTRPRRIDPSR